MFGCGWRFCKCFPCFLARLSLALRFLHAKFLFGWIYVHGLVSGLEEINHLNRFSFLSSCVCLSACWCAPQVNAVAAGVVGAKIDQESNEVSVERAAHRRLRSVDWPQLRTQVVRTRTHYLSARIPFILVFSIFFPRICHVPTHKLAPCFVFIFHSSCISCQHAWRDSVAAILKTFAHARDAAPAGILQRM